VEKKHKSKKTTNPSPEPTEDREARIVELEAQIIESRRHYNNIAALLSIARSEGKDAEASFLAVVALCRVYCRLLAAGSLGKSKGAPESELVIVQWLKERLNEYVDLLVELMGSEESDRQTTALALGMRLVKEEVNHHGPAAWDRGVFSRVIARGVLTHGTNAEPLRGEFIAMYLKKYDDIRFHTFGIIS
jgi:U3 small nucleolar RNA-associated protein 19